MKTFKVVLGLGRMSDHHPMVLTVEAPNQAEAASLARLEYNVELDKVLPKGAPIRRKFLTVESVEEVTK